MNIQSIKENLEVYEDNGKVIALDTQVNDELLEEGLYRELLRYCQVLRKEAEFDLVDRIQISFISKNDKINSMISKYKAQLEEETLSKVFTEELDKKCFEKTIDMDGSEIIVQMDK